MFDEDAILPLHQLDIPCVAEHELLGQLPMMY
jgi:hypothetical protein